MSHHNIFSKILPILSCLFLIAGCTPSRELMGTPEAQVISSLTSLPVTATPRPTPVQMETAIPPTAQAVPPIPTATADGFSDDLSDLLLVSFRDEAGVLLLDQDGTILQSLGEATGWYSFSEDPCRLFRVSKTDWEETGLHVDTIDLDGNILERTKIESNPALHDSLTGSFDFSQSLDRKWISYVTVDDASDSPLDPRTSKSRNIFLLKVDPADGVPRRLTQNGGAPFHGSTWSPDSRSLAFSERDQNGVVQIFTLDINTHQKTQITNLDTSYREYELWQVQYSPDGKFLAFIGDFERRGYGGIIRLEDRALQWLQFPAPTFYPGINLFWNQGSTQLLVLLNSSSKNNNGYNQDLIAWFDVETGHILKTFPERGQKFYVISNAFPLKNLDVVGFLGAEKEEDEGGYYRYDARDGSLEMFELPVLCCLPHFPIVPKTEFRPSACENK